MFNTLDILYVMYNPFPLPHFRHMSNSYNCFLIRCHCNNIAYKMILSGEY